MSKPTPARRCSPWATPEYSRVHPLSRNWVPEPMLCVEVSLTISSWSLTTSHLRSGFLLSNMVRFHVPIARGLAQGLGHQGILPRLPPKSLCTFPSWNCLWVVGLQEVEPTSPFRPGPVCTDPATRCSPANPNPRPGSRVGPR